MSCRLPRSRSEGIGACRAPAKPRLFTQGIGHGEVPLEKRVRETATRAAGTGIARVEPAAIAVRKRNRGTNGAAIHGTRAREPCRMHGVRAARASARALMNERVPRLRRTRSALK